MRAVRGFLGLLYDTDLLIGNDFSIVKIGGFSLLHFAQHLRINTVFVNPAAGFNSFPLALRRPIYILMPPRFRVVELLKPNDANISLTSDDP